MTVHYLQERAGNLAKGSDCRFVEQDFAVVGLLEIVVVRAKEGSFAGQRRSSQRQRTAG